MPCPNGSNYKNKCRCSFCRENKREIQRTYRRRKAQQQHGIISDSDLVPAATAQRRVREARRHGATFAELSRMTGLRHEYLQAFVVKMPHNTPPKRIRRRTERRIMEGVPEYDSRTFLPTSKVPITKARQITHSLSAMGWTTVHQRDIIEKNTGQSGKFVHHLSGLNRTGLLKKNEELMIWLEKAIGNRQGPSKKSATLMTNRGHFPTKHYDAYGVLKVHTLSPEQKAIYARVQSSHD